MVVDDHGGGSAVQQGQLQRRYSNMNMVAAEMQEGNIQDAERRRLWFLDNNGGIDELWKG